MLLVLIQRLLQTQEYVQVVICMYIYIYILVSMLLGLNTKITADSRVCAGSYMYVYIYIS